MGTTDNFDSALATLPVASSTFPVLLTAGAGAKNHTLDAIAPFTGRYRFCTLSGNLGTLSSLGTDTAGINGTTWFADVYIPVVAKSLTGIGVLHGGTVATDKMIVSLYDSTGALLANSATAGVSMAGTNAFQEYPFTAAYTILKPGRYWLGAQTNGANATIRTIAAATWIDVLATNVSGTFATIPALTPPTTFTAGKGPVAYAY